MRHQGRLARLGAHPIGDHAPPEPEGRERAARLRRQGSGSQERVAGDSYRRQVELGSEMECQPGSPRVVATRRIDQQELRSLRQPPNRLFQEHTLPKSQEPRLVGAARRPASPRDAQQLTRAEECCRGPARLPGISGARPPPRKADEAPRDRKRPVGRRPKLSLRLAENLLNGD